MHKKYLFVLFILMFILPFHSFAETIRIPSAKEFNLSLQKYANTSAYWGYQKDIPKQVVVVKDTVSGNISYYPTTSTSQIVFDNGYVKLTDGHSFHSFYFVNGDLKPSFGSTTKFDVTRFIILYPSSFPDVNGGNYVPQRPDDIILDGGFGGSNSDIPDVPGTDMDFDIDPNSPNKGFFGSLANFFNKLYKAIISLIAFLKNIADKFYPLIDNLLRISKKTFELLLKYSNPVELGKLFVDVFHNIFVVDLAYVNQKLENSRSLFVERVGIERYEHMFDTFKFFEAREFIDVNMSFNLMGKELNATILDAKTMNKIADKARPFLSFFFYTMLALYHFNQIYFLIRGTSYFNPTPRAKETSSSDITPGQLDIWNWK